MEVYQGKSVFGGIAIGRISVHKKDEQQVKRVRIEDSEQEILRYRQAKQTAMEQLQGLYQKALKEVERWVDKNLAEGGRGSQCRYFRNPSDDAGR